MGTVPLCAVILFFSSDAMQAQATENAVVPEGTSAPATTQSPAPPAAPQQATPIAPGQAQAPEQAIDKRIFGVLPNYRTASGTAPYMPITVKQKF